MSQAHIPYDDGKASQRVITALATYANKTHIDLLEDHDVNHVSNLTMKNSAAGMQNITSVEPVH